MVVVLFALLDWLRLYHNIPYPCARLLAVVLLSVQPCNRCLSLPAVSDVPALLGQLAARVGLTVPLLCTPFRCSMQTSRPGLSQPCDGLTACCRECEAEMVFGVGAGVIREISYWFSPFTSRRTICRLIALFVAQPKAMAHTMIKTFRKMSGTVSRQPLAHCGHVHPQLTSHQSADRVDQVDEFRLDAGIILHAAKGWLLLC